MGEHMLFTTGIRRLGTKENGFLYRYPDTGETVREERVLRRIEELKVPPAYREVRIARGPSAKVQAIGYDSSGKLQYVYSRGYRERKEREKFERVLRFADVLPEMRRVTSNHLRRKRLDREKVLATMTRLINAAYFRVGEERYAKRNSTFGIATVRRKHLRIEGDDMIFEYAGKWGQHQRKCVTDPRLRRVVEECLEVPGYEVFKYLDDAGEVRDVKARDLNAVRKGGHGRRIHPQGLPHLGRDPDSRCQARGARGDRGRQAGQVQRAAAVDDVAQRLGNTRDIARASYISPRVIDHYLEGSVVAYQGERLEEIIAAEQGDLTAGEQAAVGPDQQKTAPGTPQSRVVHTRPKTVPGR